MKAVRLKVGTLSFFNLKCFFLPTAKTMSMNTDCQEMSFKDRFTLLDLSQNGIYHCGDTKEIQR